MEKSKLIHPNNTSPLPNGDLWYSDKFNEELCENCHSELSMFNFKTVKHFIFYTDEESSRKTIIYNISICGCCKIDKLKEFLMLDETKEQIDSYRELIALKSNFTRMYFKDKFIFDDFNRYKETYDNLVLEYEKSILNYNLKYPPCDTLSKKLINSFRNVVSSLLDLKKESDLKENLKILNNALNFSDIDEEIYESLDLFPGSDSETYQKAKESFKSNSS